MKLTTGKKRDPKAVSSFWSFLSGKKNQGGFIALVLLCLLLPSPALAIHETCVDWYNDTSDSGGLGAMTAQASSVSYGGGWSPSYCPAEPLEMGGVLYKKTSFDTITKYERWATNSNCATWRYSFNDPCTPPITEPATCENGIQDADETGIDCGGSCISPDDSCTEYCPELWTLNNGVCSSPALPMINGVCPPNYDDIQDLTNQLCIEQELSTYASADYLTADPPDQSFELREADTNTVSSATYSKVDNGDGTTSSTITETETTTADNALPIVTTTTTITIYNTATGEPLSVSTTKDVDKDEIVGEVVSLGELDGTGNEINAGSINFAPLYAVQSASLERFPISLITTMTGVFDTWEEAPSPPKWDLELNNPWGQNWAFSIDLEPMSDLALIVRQMMACFLVICGFFLIYKRWV